MLVYGVEKLLLCDKSRVAVIVLLLLVLLAVVTLVAISSSCISSYCCFVVVLRHHFIIFSCSNLRGDTANVCPNTKWDIESRVKKGLSPTVMPNYRRWSLSLRVCT